MIALTCVLFVNAKTPESVWSAMKKEYPFSGFAYLWTSWKRLK